MNVNNMSICCQNKIPFKNEKGEITLLRAAFDGDYKQCVMFLDRFNDPDVVSVSTGQTALMSAAMWGHTEICELLLEHGANPNKTNKYGRTALMTAVNATKFEVCELLLRNGADTNICEGDGTTSLLHASWTGDFEMCKLLLKEGANPNVANNNGWTPLWMAARLKKFNLCRMLIHSGAETEKLKNDEVKQDLLDLVELKQDQTMLLTLSKSNQDD